jgi:hypothetical protein
MNMPLCHKCADGLFALNVDCPHKSQTFVGCRRDSRINHWTKTQTLCPILPKAIDVEVIPNNAQCRRTPGEWCEMFGVKVVDPDGWRGRNPTWFTAIPFDMFLSRYCESTTRVLNQTVFRKSRLYRALYKKGVDKSANPC